VDPVTHTAIGFTIAQAGAKRLTKNWAWVMFFAASAPDVDGLFFLPGNVNVLDWHRHFTHALLFAPVMAAAVVIGVKYVLRREVDVRGAFGLALMGVIAHDLVDAMTYRGTRLLLPFSDHHFALGIESFFDPVLYLILALTFAVPFLSNLVSGEIGARRGSGAITASLMLFVMIGWFGARWTFREQALAEMASRIYAGEAPRRLDVFPSFHPLKFLGLVRGSSFQKILDVNLIDYFDPEDGQILHDQVPTVEAGKALRLASATPTAQIFLAWVRWPRPQVVRLDGDTRWVVTIEELAIEKYRTRPRVVIRLDERYTVQSEVYERSKGSTGL
jgi:membrane-bound metal-dependent hydrolase YbcI (DUF457 family)